MAGQLPVFAVPQLPAESAITLDGPEGRHAATVYASPTKKRRTEWAIFAMVVLDFMVLAPFKMISRRYMVSDSGS